MKRYIQRVAAVLAMTVAICFLSVPPMASQATPKAQVKTSKSTPKKKSHKMRNTFATPDFAYPETVGRNARDILTASLASGEYGRALLALLQIDKTIQIRHADATDLQVALCDSVAEQMPEPYRALVWLIKASRYSRQYSGHQWLYVNRVLPVDASLPESCLEWSGEQFAECVTTICRQAWDKLKDDTTPLKDVGEAITFGENKNKLLSDGWTVRDFAALRILYILEPWSTSTSWEEEEMPDAAGIIPFFANKKEETGHETRVTSLPSVQASHFSSEVKSAIEDEAEKYHTAAVVRIVFGLENNYSLPFDKRIKSLRGLYDRYCDNTPLSLYVVPDLCDAMENETRIRRSNGMVRRISEKDSIEKEMFSLCTTALERWPESPAANNVKNVRNRLTRKDFNIDFPSTAFPGQEIKGVVEASNVNEAQFLLIKLPVDCEDNLTVGKIKKIGQVVKTIPMKFEGTLPFSINDTVSIGKLEVGQYALLPSTKGNLSSLSSRYTDDRTGVRIIRVTGLSYMTAQWGSRDSQALYVVNAIDGAPVAGAAVEVFERDYRRNANDGLVSIQKGITDEKGRIQIPGKSNYVIINHAGDQVRGNVNSSYEKQHWGEITAANILTDRAIIRPGETLGYSAVVYSGKDREYAPLADTAVQMVLKDANGQKVYDEELVTDKWGRICGEVVIPEGRLLGRWTLSVIKDKNNRIGDSSIRVEEYKLPTFRVVVDAPSTEDVTPDGVLKLKGRALTYSGMPVAGAKVEVKINTYDTWISPWRRRGMEGHCSEILETDGSGKFEIALDPALLKGTPFAESTFRALVTVTDVAGETREANPYVFSFTKSKVISPEIGSKIKVTGEEVKFNVQVHDNVGVPVSTPVLCTLTPVNIAGAAAQTIEFESPVMCIPAATLPSGRWKLSFSLPGETSDETVDTQTVIWRDDDRTAPEGEGLWVPVFEITVPADEDNVEFPLGSCFGTTHVLMQTVTDKGQHTEEWLTLDGINRNVTVSAPAGGAKEVTLLALHENEAYTGRVVIVAKEETEEPEIETRTFRSNVTAGEKETWTFDIKYRGKGEAVPVMAVMSDAALNALVPFRWIFNTPAMEMPSVAGRLNSYISNFTRTYRLSYDSPRWLKETSLPKPDFRCYNRLYGSDGVLYADEVRDEVFCAVESTASSVMMDSAAPLPAPNGMMMKSRSMAAAGEMKVESADMANEFEAEIATGGNGEATETNDFELRPSELPVAFFRPDLESQPDGSLTLDVEIPNYNTTWQLQILGYTPDMKTAVKVLETTASKMVMVRTHAPRYLRTGDKCMLTATVYNNSDSPASVGGLIEVVTADGKVIARRKEKARSLEAMGSRVISVEVDVPGDVMQLYVRAYALGPRHSDGEETILEVLPESQPVTESAPFWLAPGQEKLEITLPDYGRKSQVTLSYCSNPVWTCLTALPDLMDVDSDNVLKLGGALFANGMGIGLLKTNPDMARGLKEMLAANDSILVSNLEKNVGLKTVTLPSTPWLDNATGETARMQKLGSLLDESYASKVQGAIIDRLLKLQNADGSWSWMPGMSGSTWITGLTLLKLGMLNNYGYLPEVSGRAGEMIRKGASYCEEEMVRTWRKYGSKAFSAEAVLSWLYIRRICENGDLRLKDVAGFGDIRKWGLKAIAADWKEMDVYNKATAASVLYGYGDTDTALAILESLSQTALHTPQKGMWFDRLENIYSSWPPLITTAQALEAYALITPQAPEVDLLRQWLITRRQVQDWGSDSYTSEVINAVLTCGTKWETADAIPEIRLGNRLIKPDRQETLTGAFTLHIDASEASGKRLTVTRKSDITGPAWGGVIRQYVAPAASVKAEAIPSLSVRKEIVKIVDDNGVDTGITKGREGELRVGDKVRVTLTVGCDRNMDYVALTDPRPSCLEPVKALSGYTAIDGVWCYSETRNTATNLYFDYLPKGTHVYSYECRVSHSGEFGVGPATAQSQYAPAQTAHSEGMTLEVKP